MKNTIIIFIFGLFLIGIVIAKSGKKPIPPEKIKEVIPEPKESTKPILEIKPIIKMPEKIEPFNSYQEALKAAEQYKRPIFLYFGADWCVWCNKMKAEVLENQDVKEYMMKNYIICYINVDKDKDIARKYKVSGIPDYLILDNLEQTVKIRDSGYKAKQDFLDWLKPKNVTLIEN